MKKVLVLAVILSLTAVACSAFKDNYGNEAEVLGGGNNPPPTGNMDYSADKTACTPLANVKVTIAVDKGSIKATDLVINGKDDDSKYATVVKKVGSFTNDVSIQNEGKDVLVMQFKKIGDKEIALCKVTYNDMVVTKGDITIDSFDDGTDIAKAVNAGKFSLTLDKKASVTKEAVDAIKEVAGTSTTITAEGTYYANSVVVPEKK